MIAAAVSDTLSEEGNVPHHQLRVVSLHASGIVANAQQDQSKIVKINDSIYMAPLGANVYLVTTPAVNVIDTGTSSEAANAREFLRAESRAPVAMTKDWGPDCDRTMRVAVVRGFWDRGRYIWSTGRQSVTLTY
jgi:hypothetical protein